MGLCSYSGNIGPIIMWIYVQLKVCWLPCLLVNARLNWGGYHFLSVWVEDYLTFLDYSGGSWGMEYNLLDILGDVYSWWASLGNNGFWQVGERVVWSTNMKCGCVRWLTDTCVSMWCPCPSIVIASVNHGKAALDGGFWKQKRAELCFRLTSSRW